MSLNQNIRHSPYNEKNINNPHGLYDYLIIGQTLKGAGVPSNSIGTYKSSYTDTSTGIEYLKNNSGEWEPFINYSSFSPPPTVPDPLEVDELRTDLIKGKTSDSITLNAGLIGDINISLGGSNFMDVNSGNIKIQGNGNLISASDVTGYALFSNNGAGKLINIESNTGKIEATGVQPFNILNATSGQSIDLTTQGDAGAFVNLKCKGVKYKNSGGFTLAELDDLQQLKLYKNGSGTAEALFMRGSDSSIFSTVAGVPLKISHEISFQNIQLSTKSTGKIVFINATKNLNFDAGTGIISNSGTAQPLVVKNETSDQPLNLQTTGTADKVNIFSSLGLEMNTTPINGVAGINNSLSINENKCLSVDTFGTMSWQRLPETLIFTFQNVGSNGSKYMDLVGFAPNPGEVSVYPCFDADRRIRSLQAVLMSNVPWTWGGGSLVYQVFTVAPNLPCTEANAVTLFSVSATGMVSDYYFTNSGDLNETVSQTKIGVRLAISGTTPTASTAELVVKLVLQ